jgi:uncharacterized protein (TIGR02466 family)
MARITHHFVTPVYRDELTNASERRLLRDLEQSCRQIAMDDVAGQRWAEANDYPGYTSYASLNDLAERDPAFADLRPVLDARVSEFAKAAAFDLEGRRLILDSLWINVLQPGGHHTAHIHPRSAVSGTLYVAVPKGASAITFEDPRLGFMMAAPMRVPRAPASMRSFISVAPKRGTLLLWESWLRHEVPVSHANTERISISFNYRLS